MPERRPSVVHITKASGVSGSERHLLALLPAQVDRDWDVAAVVLVDPGGDAFVDALRTRGIPTDAVAAGPDVNPAAVLRLRDRLAARRPDLVHTHLLHADLHGQAAARLVRRPAVSTVHSAQTFFSTEPYRTAAALAQRSARATIAISHHVARCLRDARVVRPERLRVVHYGIDASSWCAPRAAVEEARRRHAGGVAGDRLVVGVASRLVGGKGHDVLLRAVRRANEEGARLHLLVAGDGPTRAELERTVKADGLAADVSFLGFVEDIAAFLSACDVVAFPTQPEYGEGFGLAALEAMAAGRPVVATDVASLPEVVGDGEVGLVPPGDAAAMAASLVRLARDPELRARVGAANRARAVERFGLGPMVDATLAIYADALGAGPGDRA